MCVFSLENRLNPFPHSPHTCGLSPVCVLFSRFWSDNQVRLFPLSPRSFPVAAANIYILCQEKQLHCLLIALTG
ncbi:hypothetical protein FKM82_024008 [Ascaphus truei]